MTTTLAAGALLGTTIPAGVMAQDDGDDADLDDEIAELVEALRALIGDQLGDRVLSFVITLDDGELTVSPVTTPGSTPTTTPTTSSTVADDDDDDDGDDDDGPGDDDRDDRDPDDDGPGDDDGPDDDGPGDDDDGPGDDD